MGRQYSHKELITIALQTGWTINEKRGKGSHAMLMKEGEQENVLFQYQENYHQEFMT